MIWDDIGFLISKNKYNENSLITEIYTKNHGKISGIIFGGTSKKLKIIFKLEINFPLIIILNLKIRLDFLRLKLKKFYHLYILKILKNCHVSCQLCN